jgi:catechol 2,3-dioxygenase-like lactoylglutathione lyase family enzyme
MYAIDRELAGQENVTLYVRDPLSSQEFYRDLFGMIVQERYPPGLRRLAPPGEEMGLSLTLRTGSTASSGPVWLSLEVDTVSEVLDLYLLAIMMGAKAMLPRKRGTRWATVITDPDGNRISVWTHVDADVADDRPGKHEPDLRPCRWQWRLSPHETDRHPDDREHADDRRSSTTSTRVRRTELSGMGDVPGRCAGADRVDRRPQAGTRPPVSSTETITEEKE